MALNLDVQPKTREARMVRPAHHERSSRAGRGMRPLRSLVIVLACVICAKPGAQESPADAARRKTFDQILDLYVRGGDVYYRAIKAERAKLDGYVSLLATAPVAKLSRDEQLAFWLNAYNALVLRTVVDHYPIQGRSADYPTKSIRQIPGQFERDAGKVNISSIFSWREKEFVAAYADAAPPAFAARGPIERAVLTFVGPTLLPTEKEFIAKNTFQVAYTPFDWTLNDLTGRGGR